MLRVGPHAMADVVGLHFGTFEIDEVEAGLGRMEAEIGNADDVVLPDRTARAQQFPLGDVEQDSVARGAGSDRRKQAGRQRQCCPRCQSAFQKIPTLH